MALFKLFYQKLLYKKFFHPWEVTAFYLLGGSVLIFLSYFIHPRPFLNVIGLMAGGFILWTLIEYILHRRIFHLTGIKNPFLIFARGNHLGHHQYPDQDSMITPPVGSLAYGLLVFFLLNIFTLSFSASALIEVGVFFGYIAYEWAHYSAHRFKPKTRLGRYLKTYHLHHHFKNPHENYGVTSPFWDYVFNTSPKRIMKGKEKDAA